MNGEFYSRFDDWRKYTATRCDDVYNSYDRHIIRCDDDYYWNSSSLRRDISNISTDNFIISEEEDEVYIYRKTTIFDQIAKEVLEELDPENEFLYINGFTNDSGGINICTSGNKNNMIYMFDFNSNSEEEKSRFKTSISKWIMSLDV
jgi:hypothetical protein